VTDVAGVNQSTPRSDHAVDSQTEHTAVLRDSTNLSSTEIGTSPTTVSSLIIPENWRPEVMQSIRSRCLSDSAKNEMIRVLANLLFSLSSKPTRQQCDEMAKRLILKYPSTKDQLGNGYVRQYCIIFFNLNRFFLVILE